MSDAQTILVTGGCGYLGSQLIRELGAAPGRTVRILDNFQRPNHRALMNLPRAGRYQFIEGDILDPSVLEVALHGVDGVVHLAAIVQTPLSFEEPQWTEQVNHWGTAHLVNACIEAGVRRFVYASSTAAYGPGGPNSEADPCRPVGAYAQSKHHAEHVVLSGGTRGLAPTVLRLGSLFGLAPVVRFDAVANRLAYLAGVGRALTVYGDGSQTRPLLHVRDASNAICWAVERDAPPEGEVLNVASEDVSVARLVQVIRETRPQARVHHTDQDIRTHFSFGASSARIRALGWAPQVGLAEGMAELIESFQGFASPFGVG